MEMEPQTQKDRLLEDLTALNQIIDTLNRTLDVREALDSTLKSLVKIMGLQTGWIFLRESDSPSSMRHNTYHLAAHYNLPPAIAVEKLEVWRSTCDCQTCCDLGELKSAYNELHCSRLRSAQGDRRGLTVHASAPLRSGSEILGIINVAAPDWSSFSARSLEFLTNVGNHLGVTLERAHLYDLLRERRIHEQRTLIEFSEKMLRRYNLAELIKYLVEEIPRLLHAEACALLLLDETDQQLRFYARYGWDTATQSIVEIPDEVQAWLSYAMHTAQLQMIGDLSEDNIPHALSAWFKTQRFYTTAAAPLIGEHSPIGLLLLSSRSPFKLDENNTYLLKLLTNQAALAIDNARLYQAELNGQRMQAEMDMGSRIQRSLLPREIPQITGWEFAVVYQPARQVGGDFYDFIEIPNFKQNLGLVIADVVDKGVPAALVMALCRTTFRSSISPYRTPADLLSYTNTIIRKDSGRYGLDESQEEEIFVSAIYAELDIENCLLTYANAGHNRPLLIKEQQAEIEELTARGIVLGLLDEIDLEECQIRLQIGDSILFYTDGISEAMNADGQAFNKERILSHLHKNLKSNAQETLDSLITAVEAFTAGEEQSDDLTAFIIRRVQQC